MTMKSPNVSQYQYSPFSAGLYNLFAAIRCGTDPRCLPAGLALQPELGSAEKNPPCHGWRSAADPNKEPRNLGQRWICGRRCIVSRRHSSGTGKKVENNPQRRNDDDGKASDRLKTNIPWVPPNPKFVSHRH
jgi:hypothetical protein